MTATLDPQSFDPAIAMARQALYRFAALCLVDPRSGSWQRLNSLRDDPVVREAACILRVAPEAAPDNLQLDGRPLTDVDPSLVIARLPRSPEAMNECFDNTFGLLASSACPPHETDYIDGKFSFQRSNTLADVNGFYCAFGVRASQQHPQRPDHVVQELEFMAVLIDLMRHADRLEPALRGEQVGVCHAAQVRFLRDHLAWWTPTFARLLARETRGGYYEAVAVYLAAFLSADCWLLGIPPVSKPPLPTGIEPPEVCNGCMLSP